ncbi:hypothetical protein DSO57_1007414 [Entomophthora muscae]|uniref:Uncharacterized protein n=1 Tax=Entomophthora muscae TaxID=34485 RepID=A0ACC2SK91_9FUNG|nr:hypothetical protein DSO57_1007414 [Entomophthora muscae]
MGNGSYDLGFKCLTKLPLKIGQNFYPALPIILNGLPHPLILGDSWSQNHGAILNFCNQTVAWKGEKSCNVAPFQLGPTKGNLSTLLTLKMEPSVGACGIPVHQSPNCVLDCSQGLAGRDCHSPGLKWAFIHSQKEDPLRKLLVYGAGGQENNMNLPILGVLQQYLGLLVLGLGLLLLRPGLLHLKLGLWCCA